MKTNSFSDCFLLGRTSIDNDASWFQTLPAIGEYPDKQLIVKGKKVTGTIVVDQTAVDSCLAAFKEEQSAGGPEWKGVLVDREHFSLMANKESDAMAWAKDIRGGADGVWTRWDFTEPGKKLWDGKILVSRSPVMELEPLGGNRYRPVAISSIAMTNTPQFETLATFAAARAAEGSATPDVAQNKGDQTMKKLLALLGLPETATEDEACAKVTALQTAQTAAEADMKKAQAACRKTECEAFIAANKTAIENPDAFRAAFDKDPEMAKAVFGSFRKAPAPGGTRIVARDANTPKASVPEAKPEAQIAAKRQAAVNSYRAGNPGVAFATAWSACRAADPELFADDAAE
jgi:hypothetical protein